MPLKTAYQRKWKSGACEDYFNTFGHQDDPRVYDRTVLSIRDRMVLRRLASEHKRQRWEQARELRMARAAQAADRAKTATKNAKPSVIAKLANKLRQFSNMLKGRQ